MSIFDYIYLGFKKAWPMMKEDKELFIFTGSLQNQKPITIAFKVWPVMKLAARYKKYLNRLEKAADALNNQPGTVQIMTFLYLYGIINLFRN